MSAENSVVLTLRFVRAANEYRLEEADGGAGGSVTFGDISALFPRDNPKELSARLTPEDARSLGNRLFEIFFQGGILERLTVLRRAAISSKSTVRVHIDLEAAEELDDLPWELLADPGSGNTIVPVRSLPSLALKGVAAANRPLHILTLVASPEDLPTFDLEREWEILGQALAGLTSGGSVAVERLDDCSEANLQRVLTQQTFQVLHFVGYGRSNLRARYGSLVLIDEHRNSRAMPAEYLGKLLGQTTVRLAVLDFGRRVDEFNPFAEAARGLVRNGINSVIAMRRRLSSTAATTFYQGLYSALASGSAVDQSVESARRAMTQSPGEVEWDIPMLYTAMGNQAALSIENAAQDSGRVRDLAGSARVGTANTQISVERPAIEHSTQNLSSGPNHRRVKISAAPLDQTREHPHKIKKILVLAASPENLTQLRLGEEMREIASGLLRAKYRQRFQLENRLAVRPLDLQQAMVEVQPQIVHFCGHGAGLDGLVFEDNNGLSKPIPSAALANLFKLFSDKIECVVLNSCHSDPQAKAISEHIPYVIGMKAQVGDRAAIDFAIGFYRALGAGYAIDFAFRLGCSAIELENLPDYLTPVMRERSDISGNEAVM